MLGAALQIPFYELLHKFDGSWVHDDIKNRSCRRVLSAVFCSADPYL